jgi:hypothetical protein
LHRISSIEYEKEKKGLSRLEKIFQAAGYGLKGKKGSKTLLCRAQGAWALDGNHF